MKMEKARTISIAISVGIHRDLTMLEMAANKGNQDGLTYRCMAGDGDWISP